MISWRNSPMLQLALVTMALIGFALPWVNGGSVSLRLNILDLAEWLSLLPAVRSNIPILLPALLLRMSVVLGGWLLAALAMSATHRWIQMMYTILIIVLWVAILPAVAFFTGQIDDRNYQQQAVLWVSYPLGVWLVSRVRSLWLVPVLAVLSAAFGFVGVLWGWRLLNEYQVEFLPEIGSIVTTAGLLALSAGRIPSGHKRAGAGS